MNFSPFTAHVTWNHGHIYYWMHLPQKNIEKNPLKILCVEAEIFQSFVSFSLIFELAIMFQDNCSLDYNSKEKNVCFVFFFFTVL